MGRRQRADRGTEGWGPPHQKAKDPSPQQTNPRATPSRDSTGPLVGPSRTQFHWATRPTMTWRHAGWGHGILRRSGCPFCLSCSAYSCPPAPVPFRGSNAGRTGGFAAGFAAAHLLAALCSPLDASPRDLWPPAGPCSDVLSSFCDLRGGVEAPGGRRAGMGRCVTQSERSGALGG